jgi:hypothetical protein
MVDICGADPLADQAPSKRVSAVIWSPDIGVKDLLSSSWIREIMLRCGILRQNQASIKAAAKH